MSFAYLPWYTGDYRRDTPHLSMMEHGAYRQMLDFCWDQRGPLPLDERRIFAICNARSAEEMGAVRNVLSEFFVSMDDGHYNKRIQEEIERCSVISGKRAGAAHERWNARAKLKDIAQHNANAMQVHSKSSANAPSPSPSPSPYQEKEIIKLSLDSTRAPPEVPDCPHKEVLRLWSEILPNLPRHDPGQWRGSRADHLRARWRETAVSKGWKDSEEGIRHFKRLFAYVGQSRFLTGRVQPRTPDARPFVAELEWLVKPLNWAKVVEGKYHQEERV
jgi:uncharacterized protein YdaU (DUF1376 family)